MSWVLVQMKESSNFLSHEPPPPPPPSPPPPSPSQYLQSSGFDLNDKVSPSILLIIIILAIIFFVSGLLHLLIRFLLSPPNREPQDLDLDLDLDIDSVTALQGQLQQLFHLHDSGVDQSFIDTLPIFNYKSIIGLKNPFDCAVCLCEFESDDKLRLLPKCSHAFHMECIDTWLLSHSTCPLCRACLVPDFDFSHNNNAPFVLVLESASSNDSSREMISSERDHNSNSGSTRFESAPKLSELMKTDGFKPDPVEKIVPLKLGKFRNIDGGGGGGEGSSKNTTSSNSIDERRCFSMGSFEYVMDENSSLQVSVMFKKKPLSKVSPLLPLRPGHRAAMSECDCESKRVFKFNGDSGRIGGETCNVSKKESFSVSKIWLRDKTEKEKLNSSSRRAFSSRFPSVRSEIGGGNGMNLKGKELSCDMENQSCNSLDSSQGKTPSFARKTLLWLVGRQNKVVHSSFTPNV